MTRLNDDEKTRGHTIIIEFEAGCMPRFKLDCGDGSDCKPPVYCGECGRHIDDQERKRCSYCLTGDEECALATWFDGGDPPEFVSGTVGPLAFDIESWDDDGPVITLTDTEAS